MSSAQRLWVELGEGADRKEVVVGAFAQIAAKREYGIEAIRDGDPEPLLFGVWVELNGRPPATGTREAFDRWLEQVHDFGLADGSAETGGEDDADPPQADPSA